MNPSSSPSVAVIVPVMNEEATIGTLSERVLAVAAASGTFRLVAIVFIDDGSSDGTWERIVSASRVDDRVRGVRLRRNFGKATALQSVSASRCRHIVTRMATAGRPGRTAAFHRRHGTGFDVVSG